MSQPKTNAGNEFGLAFVIKAEAEQLFNAAQWAMRMMRDSPEKERAVIHLVERASSVEHVHSLWIDCDNDRMDGIAAIRKALAIKMVGFGLGLGHELGARRKITVGILVTGIDDETVRNEVVESILETYIKLADLPSVMGIAEKFGRTITPSEIEALVVNIKAKDVKQTSSGKGARK